MPECSERPCSKCGIVKPPESFYRTRRAGRAGRRTVCSDCLNAARRRKKQSKAERLEGLDWRTTVPIIPCPKNRVPGRESRFWSPEERFWQKTKPGEDGCIVWTSALCPCPAWPGKFYGRFSIGRRPRQAHRYAYGLAYGKIPNRFEVHHTCRNSLCVNPEHLEVLSRADHVKVSGNALKTHCPHGHPYDEQNTTWRGGRRFCLTCQAASNKATNARVSEARRKKREQSTPL